jgi:hypothetical protein
MTASRLLISALLLTASSFATSCKKEDPAPLTGSLKITITNFSKIQGSSYYLYTETGWAGTQTSSSLLQAKVTAAEIVIDDLNTGNYVFTVSGVSPRTVQVTAGETNTFSYTF